MPKKKGKFVVSKQAKKIAIGVGAGLAAAAAAGAAANYFFGKKGAKHRKQAKNWVNKAKKQVLAQVKKVKKLDKKVYDQIVDAVTQEFSAFKDVNADELRAVAGKLKNDWTQIKKQTSTVKKAVKKAFKNKNRK